MSFSKTLKRSFLFVPGSNEKLIGKALATEADAVIIDLEDSVAVGEKENARKIALAAARNSLKGCYIRINAWTTPWHERDLQEAAAAGIAGIMLPKSEDADTVLRTAEKLPTGCDLIPLIETARGVLRAHEVAACSDRISRLAFGALDFTLDIGTRFSKTGTELIYARSHLVIASRAADIFPPVDSVYPDLADPDSLRSELNEVRGLGMFGKLAIHPNQIDPIHKTFTPAAEEVEEAELIVKEFEKAEKEGIASIKLNDKLVDYPVYTRAKRILDLSRQLRQG